jgi:uncharacterized protein YdeI (YjbR/CyaY-like superfamily)
MSKVADVFFKREKKWPNEMRLLRDIVLECDLVEDFKWMHPCYTNNGKNIVLIHGFKEYCALLFHKGALLSDPQNLLIQQTENSQITRQLRFKNVNEIDEQRTTILSYIQEAIENEQAGKEVELKKTADYDFPEELISKFIEDPNYETAFNALTPGRQRGYLLHFSQAKQSKTRMARIEKSRSKILEGKGLNDWK